MKRQWCIVVIYYERTKAPICRYDKKLIYCFGLYSPQKYWLTTTTRLNPVCCAHSSKTGAERNEFCLGGKKIFVVFLPIKQFIRLAIKTLEYVVLVYERKKIRYLQARTATSRRIVSESNWTSQDIDIVSEKGHPLLRPATACNTHRKYKKNIKFFEK